MLSLVKQLSVFSALLVLAAAELDFYDFSAQDIHGKWVTFEKYRGKVTLVVNVASQCGYTDGHYRRFRNHRSKSENLVFRLIQRDLVRIQSLLQYSRKFNVFAFPCNQFLGQEPGTNAEIFDFAQMKYQVNFPMFSKIDVLGENEHDVYRYLSHAAHKQPEWNFWKYLVDHHGKVIGVWGPDMPPTELAPQIKAAVEDALREEEMDRLKAYTPSPEL